MDGPVVSAPTKYRRLLPYLAVFQTDLRQTMRSWVYRLWVLCSLVTAIGYLLYRYGIYREAGIIQSASMHTSELIRWVVVGSLALIVVLTVSSIASERGTLADSILSRGISRYQYFLAKWHSRSVAILATFATLAGLMLLASSTLLSEDLSVTGGLVGIATVALFLLVIVSWGVTIGALTSSSILGITLLWLILYGCGFLMTLLPASYPTPEKVMHRLPHILRGHYSLETLVELGIGAFVLSFIAAVVGIIGFSRKDV